MLNTSSSFFLKFKTDNIYELYIFGVLLFIIKLLDEFVNPNKSPGPADPCAAVHQQWPAPSVVGVEQHVGQLDQGDQVAGVTSSGGRPDIISGQ